MKIQIILVIALASNPLMAHTSSAERYCLMCEAALKGQLSSEIVRDDDPKVTFKIYKLRLGHPIDVYDEDGKMYAVRVKTVQVEFLPNKYLENAHCIAVTGRLTSPEVLTEVYDVVIEAKSAASCAN